MKTLKDFVALTCLPPKLVRAVVQQVGGWREFEDRAPDVVNHGADGGFSGFIYYTDTVAFAKRHKAPILAAAKDVDDTSSSVGIIRFVAGFRCVEETEEDIAKAIFSGRGDAVTRVYNALAWFALEEVSRAYVDCLEYQQ